MILRSSNAVPDGVAQTEPMLRRSGMDISWMSAPFLNTVKTRLILVIL